MIIAAVAEVVGQALHVCDLAFFVVCVFVAFAVVEGLHQSSWCVADLEWHRSGGLALVIAVQFGLVTCMGVFNPVLAAYRLEQTPADRVARTLAAWSVTSSATIAGMTALWGVLAAIMGPRMAIALAGVLMLATPFLLPRRDGALEPDRAPTQPAPLLAPADG